jgi:hypothetical protein
MNWLEELNAIVETQPALRHKRPPLLPKPGRGSSNDTYMEPLEPDYVGWQTYAIGKNPATHGTEAIINSGSLPIQECMNLLPDIIRATQHDPFQMHTYLELVRRTKMEVDFYISFGGSEYMLLISSYNRKALEAK